MWFFDKLAEWTGYRLSREDMDAIMENEAHVAEGGVDFPYLEPPADVYSKKGGITKDGEFLITEQGLVASVLLFGVFSRTRKSFYSMNGRLLRQEKTDGNYHGLLNTE